jgi:hypothetical protein
VVGNGRAQRFKKYRHGTDAQRAVFRSLGARPGKHAACQLLRYSSASLSIACQACIQAREPDQRRRHPAGRDGCRGSQFRRAFRRYPCQHASCQQTAAPQVSTQGDRIEFSTADGSGQLILLRHSWVAYGQVPPTSGSYLRVEVELTCDSGSVDYDPYNFQVFDQTGKLFETAIEGAGDSMLETGTLHAGERVRGTVAFDMPRSEATLLMSDDSNQTVTALKVPD